MPLEWRGIHREILADKTPEILIQGARMCAKTWVCSAKVIESCLENPGIWWLICRYSGTETDNQLRPVFKDVCRQMGVAAEWHSDESAYWFPEKNGKISKVFAYGLKSQSKDERFAKVRGSGVAGLWNDQTEETPEDIGTEMRALIRQPGYPHQLLLSPNPPGEEHYLADQFPDDQDLPGRKYYRLSLQDNRHNLAADSIEKLERLYPPTHAKHKSLILGQRGPNVTGKPVYEGAFDRTLHVGPAQFDPSSPLLESFHAGLHHPTWIAAQRSPFGAIRILGGIIGKRLFLEDFLPLVETHREEWFPNARDLRVCCDPQIGEASRHTTVSILREAGLKPRSRENGSAPDVRVSMIEYLGGQMKRRAGNSQAFLISDDPSRFLMASTAIVKQTKLLVDGCEGSYVWSKNYVSVGNKTVRQPEFDEWLEGQQRCIENIALNFCAGLKTDEDKDEAKRRNDAKNRQSSGIPMSRPDSWMSS